MSTSNGRRRTTLDRLTVRVARLVSASSRLVRGGGFPPVRSRGTHTRSEQLHHRPWLARAFLAGHPGGPWPAVDLLWWSDRPDEPAPSGDVPPTDEQLDALRQERYRSAPRAATLRAGVVETDRQRAVAAAAARFDELLVRRRSSGRRTARVLGVTALAGATSAAAALLLLRPSAGPAASTPSTPPSSAGRIIATATSGAFTADQARPLSVAGDEEVRLTVRCRGVGAVRISLTVGQELVFPCRGPRAAQRRQDVAAPAAPFVYALTAPHGAEWALTLAAVAPRDAAP